MDQWTPTASPLNELSPPHPPQEYQSFHQNLEQTTNEYRKRWKRLQMNVKKKVKSYEERGTS